MGVCPPLPVGCIRHTCPREHLASNTKRACPARRPGGRWSGSTRTSEGVLPEGVCGGLRAGRRAAERGVGGQAQQQRTGPACRAGGLGPALRAKASPAEPGRAIRLHHRRGEGRVSAGPLGHRGPARPGWPGRRAWPRHRGRTESIPLSARPPARPHGSTRRRWPAGAPGRERGAGPPRQAPRAQGGAADRQLGR